MSTITEAVRKLIVISFDAVSTADIARLLTMPRFSVLASKSTLVKDVESVFITNTYPCHASIVSGVHPNKHGIIENTIHDPAKQNQEWYAFSKYFKARNFPIEARRAGRTVCSLLWPVMGNAKINWNIPEVISYNGFISQAWTIFKSGGGLFAISQFLKHGKKLKSIAQPFLDDFVTDCACDVVLKKKPNLLLVHFTDVDTHKHDFGPTSNEAMDALARLDKRLGRIMDAVRESGEMANTDYIILGDHSCLPVKRTVDPNRYISEFKGKASFHNAGGCTFLKLEDQNDKELAKQTAQVIGEMLVNPECGFSRPLTKNEMEISGLNREYTCGFEAVEGVSFGDDHKGQHGYAPTGHKDYTTFYMASGLGIPEGETISGGCIIDVCPLAVKLLDIKPWEIEGVLRIKMKE